jgi:lysophospholipase L1-like esterase
MSRFSGFFLVVVLGLASLRASDSDPARWADDISAIERRLAAASVAPGGILFVGSSTMRLWDLAQSFPQHTLTNLGFGGAYISDQIHYFSRLITPHRPAHIIFYGGGNDLDAGKSVETVLADWQQWRQLVHRALPECRITFLAVRHCPSRVSARSREQSLNQAIKATCENDPQKRLTYLDLNHLTENPDRTYRTELFQPDQLHLSEKGYQQWSEALQSHLHSPK